MIDLHTLSDLAELDKSIELECKLAQGRDGKGELPKDFWPTYSAMDNLTSEKTSEKTSGKTSGKILALIRANPVITISELAVSIGVSERSIERNLKKLQEANLLSRIGPAKGGHWKASE